MLSTISREYTFSAAHRLEGHPKCGRLHGHNYTVIVEIEGLTDVNGMVLDYGDLDKIVKPAIIDPLDHRYLVSADNIKRNDPYATIAVLNDHAYILGTAHSTAEEMSMRMAEAVLSHLSNSCDCVAVTVRESAKSSARSIVYAQK